MPSDTVLDQIRPATRAGFREIRLATPEDYEIIHQAESAIVMQTGERLMAYLARLDVANGKQPDGRASLRIPDGIPVPIPRQAHQDSAYFELTAEFCERYDQRSFDPDYPSAPLSEFAPLMQKVFDPARLAAGGRTPVAR